jgi:hypothetical protein
MSWFLKSGVYTYICGEEWKTFPGMEERFQQKHEERKD